MALLLNKRPDSAAAAKSSNGDEIAAAGRKDPEDNPNLIVYRKVRHPELLGLYAELCYCQSTVEHEYWQHVLFVQSLPLAIPVSAVNNEFIYN